MKVAYVYLGAGLNKDSVFNKITSQIGALNELGVTTKGIFFSEIDQNHPEQIANNNLSYVKVRPVVRGWFRTLRERVRFTKSLYQWSIKNSKEYDILYIRAYRPTIYWLLFLITCWGKVITEHQTKEPEELKALWNENPFSFKPSAILSWIEHNLIPWFQEYLFGSLAIMITKNIVCVTKEIGIYEKSRAIFFKPRIHVVTNGIDVKKFKHKNEFIFDGKSLNLLMLVGGATRTDWHGIDLIVSSINNYSGDVHVKLYLAGNVDYIDNVNNNIIKLGYCGPKEIDEILPTIHLGVGSFASLRKGLMEGSSLKMREYASRGIPVIFGQIDDDFNEMCKMGLALTFNNTEVPDMNKIIQFVSSINYNNNLGDKINKYAQNKIDYSIKMQQLIEVFYKSI